MAKTVRKTQTAKHKLVKKFEMLFRISNVKNKARACRSRTCQNIAAITETVEETPGLSISRRSLDISQTILHPTLHEDSRLIIQ